LQYLKMLKVSGLAPAKFEISSKNWSRKNAINYSKQGHLGSSLDYDHKAA